MKPLEWFTGLVDELAKSSAYEPWRVEEGTKKRRLLSKANSAVVDAGIAEHWWMPRSPGAYREDARWYRYLANKEPGR